MAFVIDNTGGDPTAFGKTISDLGTQMINNRLNKRGADQRQQTIENQMSQFNMQHEIAKKQLDMQQQEFAFRKKALLDAEKIQNASNQAFRQLQRPEAIQAQEAQLPKDTVSDIDVADFIKNSTVPIQPSTQTQEAPSEEMGRFVSMGEVVPVEEPSTGPAVRPAQPGDIAGGGLEIEADKVKQFLLDQQAFKNSQAAAAEEAPVPYRGVKTPSRFLNFNEAGPEIQQEIINNLLAQNIPVGPALERMAAVQASMSQIRGESPITQEQPDLKQLLEIGKQTGVNGMEFYDSKTRKIDMPAYLEAIGDAQAQSFRADIETKQAGAAKDRAVLLQSSGNHEIMKNMTKSDEKTLSDAATKLVNYDAVLEQLKEAKLVIDDPSVSEVAKLSKAESIAKILNTPEGTDAVSGEEAERILRFTRKNFNPITAMTDSAVDFGSRNFPAFSTQIDQQIKKVTAVRNSAQAKIQDVNQRYGLQTGQTQPLEVNAPKGRVVNLKDGRRVRLDENNNILETLSK